MKVTDVFSWHPLVVDGPPRSKVQLCCRRGAIFGESRRDANSETIMYGLLRDPNFDIDSPELTDAVNNNQGYLFQFSTLQFKKI